MKLKIRFLELLWPFQKQNQIHLDTQPSSRESVEKRYIIWLLILWFIIFLFSVLRCHAQDRPLRIGDKIPDLTVSNIANFPAQSVRISDFRGKLLILDFWATWCSPCVAMISRNEMLQKRFEGKIQILPIAYQDSKTVEAFFKKRAIKNAQIGQLPEVTGDVALNKLFPHTYLPHYVWIDGNGIVRAITGYEDVTEDNINKFLNTPSAVLPLKQDEVQISYNKEKPLFVDNNGGGGRSMLYRSLISGYTPGIGSGYYLKADSINGLKVTCRNLTIAWLYMIAYDEAGYFGRNRMAVEVADTTKIFSSQSGQPYLDWLSNGNGFCYELTLPPGMADRSNEFMRADLDRFFMQYKVGLEKRRIKCLALERTSAIDKIHTSGGHYDSKFSAEGFSLTNFNLGRLISQLNAVYMRNSALPIVDNTAYSGYVDMDVEADLTDYNSLNNGLKKYDLQFRETELDIDVLAIRDRQENASNPHP